MRIVVLNRYLDGTGGAEAVARLGIEGLRARGHVVSVIALASPSDRAGFRAGRRSVEHVHWLTANNLYHPQRAAGKALPLRALWHLRDLTARRNERHVRDIVRTERPEVAITHNVKGLGLRVVRALHAAGVPHVHVLHDLQLSVASGVLLWGKETAGDARPCLRRWHEGRTQRLFGSPALVLAPSRYLLAAHTQAGFFPHSRVEVLPHPARVPAAVAPRSGVPRFLFVGQLVAHKGVRELLAAWRQHALGSAAVPGELHLAGDGALLGDVRAAAGADPTITVHGRLSPDALAALYDRTDVVVVPSLCYEGASLAAIEGLACGAFVLGSELGGIPEQIREGCGRLLPPGDVGALAQAIDDAARAIDDLRARRPAIAAAAPGMSPAEYCDRLEGLLHAVLSSPAR